jgi:cyclopentanol dehydrogenase
MRLKGKVALVTGAARGIGAEIARVFAREGAAVVIGDILEAEGQGVAEEIKAAGGVAMVVKLDVSEEPNWKRTMAFVLERLYALDILVNNAGVSKRVPLEEYPVEDWDAVMAINVRGVFLGMKHVIPILRRRGGGSIINMSSIAGLVGHKFSNLAYMTSKGGVTLLTKGAAVKYAPENIRVNSIHPCTVETELTKNISKDPQLMAERLDEVPMGRFASVADVANAALFLASDEAAFITGVALPVDGGVTAY